MSSLIFPDTPDLKAKHTQHSVESTFAQDTHREMNKVDDIGESEYQQIDWISIHDNGNKTNMTVAGYLICRDKIL